jgi:hypothetical protein
MKQARRFCPDWMIQVDGTFNTNRIRMPLIDCLGVNNTGKRFIFAFCFVTSESAENWGFVLQCLEQTVFDGLPLPRVVIADQGLGLSSAGSVRVESASDLETRCDAKRASKWRMDAPRTLLDGVRCRPGCGDLTTFPIRPYTRYVRGVIVSCSTSSSHNCMPLSPRVPDLPARR